MDDRALREHIEQRARASSINHDKSIRPELRSKRSSWASFSPNASSVTKSVSRVRCCCHSIESYSAPMNVIPQRLVHGHMDLPQSGRLRSARLGSERRAARARAPPEVSQASDLRMRRASSMSRPSTGYAGTYPETPRACLVTARDV